MTAADWVGLAGVFLGGAIPWLEAIVVIPGGIIAGLNPAATVVAGTTGNLLTVGVAAWFGEQIRTWWQARRGPSADDHSEEAEAWRFKRYTRAARMERIMRRGGLPALAFLGPFGLGTQITAVAAVGLGVSARRAFAWVGASTVVTSLAAAYAAVTGMEFFGAG